MDLMIEWLLIVLFLNTTFMSLFTTWLWRKRARNFQRQNAVLRDELDRLLDLVHRMD